MIRRHISRVIKELAKGYPAIAITGPRQSGKTTLARMLFPNKTYVSLEDPDVLMLACEDPRKFLQIHKKGAILDEVQRCPELFSYLQGVLDESTRMGRFILTGSQQFDFLSRITQSLAGRVAMVQLLPFTYGEVYSQPQTLDSVMYKGLYPPVHDRNLNPSTWFANYMNTYIERDVRQMLNVKDLRTFRRFVHLCAGRTGQLLNLSGLATDAGITHNTAKAWISILEASYLIFLLEPHFPNFNKRVIKSPKLYFYDSGLAAWLLNIREVEHLAFHPLRGNLFEGWVVSELAKMQFNMGLQSNLYFWRDQKGHEIDVLFEKSDRTVPLEIKSGQTLNSSFFKGLDYWEKCSRIENQDSWLVYGGEKAQFRRNTRVISWMDLHELKIHF
jgi:predicted AAA+ superfamily ATPase